jgi:hypothetical protein
MITSPLWKKQSIDEKSPTLWNVYTSNKNKGLGNTITLVLADKNRKGSIETEDKIAVG